MRPFAARIGLLGSGIRAGSAVVPERVAPGISAAIASCGASCITPRIAPASARRTAPAIIPISVGAVGATGVAWVIVRPGTATFMCYARRASGCSACANAWLESWLQTGYLVRGDPLASEAFDFFQINPVLA